MESLCAKDLEDCWPENGVVEGRWLCHCCNWYLVRENRRDGRANGVVMDETIQDKVIISPYQGSRVRSAHKC